MNLYTPGFFDLQWRFAQRIAALSDARTIDQIVPFTVLPALLDYRTDDPAFLDSVASTNAPAEYLYEIYRQLPKRGRDPTEHRFGCFLYVFPWRSTKKLRLHFANVDPTGHPLARDRAPSRVTELRNLVADVERRQLEVETVRGGSWLYNVEAYRDLFPSVYTDTLTALPAEPAFLSQWGQFVRGDGTVRAVLANSFIEALAGAKTTAECLAAFPLPVLKAECAYTDFKKALT